MSGPDGMEERTAELDEQYARWEEEREAEDWQADHQSLDPSNWS